MKPKALMPIALGLLLNLPAQAQNATPDDWRCTNRVGGEWLYGRGPYGCDASAFGPDSFVRESYAALIFNDAAERTKERRRYMQALYAVLRDASNRYIKARKPDVSEAERAAFERASFAVAHQETYWSHYRDASDNRLKMMRGDAGHGHGLMQVDDRYHYQAALDGKGWNLLVNYSYSMDEYFAAWERAPSQTCLQGSDNTWRNRARAAYSAYNGGPSKICRWTNPNDVWARNDKGFEDKWDGQAYANYVDDKNAVAKVAVACLMDGGTSCPPPGAPPPGEPSASWPGKLLRISDGSACVFSNNSLQCVSALRDAACLVAATGFDGTIAIDVPIAQTTGFARSVHNRHPLCRKATGSLQTVASSAMPPSGLTLRSTRSGDEDWLKVVLPRGVNLRATPGGLQVGTLPQNTLVNIKELHTRGATQEQHYRVEHNGLQGWIYSGSLLPSNSSTRWTVPMAPTVQAASCATAKRSSRAMAAANGQACS
jgi:hypothetical protein